ncbi:S8 family serine peptidase [Peterkaempfera bronchialis]|uniref:S8 family serine peptidase n=1 Tax=Peterkaempfera bronchialis TaxID=2126346 RepID=UPI0013B45445|nr:S8 family serine peptidase [Peterkaempfera bronchialis]
MVARQAGGSEATAQSNEVSRVRVRALGRVAAAAAATCLALGGGAGSASADRERDAQWPLIKYNAPQDVWPITKGGGVTIGLIDTGVLAAHQDLTGQILPGADFSGGSTDGRTDEIGHGTAMASLIVGHGHGPGRLDGVMGLAPEAKILPVKLRLAADKLDFPPGETRVADAIRYAVDHGAKVINMSIGGAQAHVSEVRSAVRYAVDHDVVLVAATGNIGVDRVGYPAAFPGVIAVGAVDVDGKVWEKSDTGPEITLVAPGVQIRDASNADPSAYSTGSGTSDATAYVSAIAALVRSRYPDLSAGQVVNRLIRSAVAPPDGSRVPNDRYGYGIASPRRALTMEIPAGPKENPLLGRAEAQAPATVAAVPGGGDSAAGEAAGSAGGGGVPVWVVVLGAGVVVAVVLVVVVVVRRRRGGGYPPYQQSNPYQQ